MQHPDVWNEKQNFLSITGRNLDDILNKAIDKVDNVHTAFHTSLAEGGGEQVAQPMVQELYDFLQEQGFPECNGEGTVISGIKFQRTKGGDEKIYSINMDNVDDPEVFAGSGNKVEIYTVNKLDCLERGQPIAASEVFGMGENAEIAIRISKAPLFNLLELKEQKTLIDKKNFEQFLQEIKMIKSANDYDIIPEVYLHTLIHNIPNHTFHLLLVGEAYDEDLKAYYGRQDQETTYFINEIDKDIARQLNELLNRLVDLEYYCVDIKPQNCVIKTELNGDVTVKLIDLETDFCSYQIQQEALK